MMHNVTLPWPPTELSPNQRLHWSRVAKAKKAYRAECCLQARSQGLRTIEAPRLHATFTFYPPSRRRLDLDNCIARIKAGIDGLVDACGVDDSRWTMTFAISDQIGGMVKVSLEPSGSIP